MSKHIYSWGVVVSPTPYKKGVMYAEVVPSGYGKWWRRFLPNVGNWWFEIMTDTETWAYEDGGSGGAYTFSGCVRKAMEAVEELAQRLPQTKATTEPHKNAKGQSKETE